MILLLLSAAVPYPLLFIVGTGPLLEPPFESVYALASSIERLWDCDCDVTDRPMLGAGAEGGGGGGAALLGALGGGLAGGGGGGAAGEVAVLLKALRAACSARPFIGVGALGAGAGGGLGIAAFP